MELLSKNCFIAAFLLLIIVVIAQGENASGAKENVDSNKKNATVDVTAKSTVVKKDLNATDTNDEAIKQKNPKLPTTDEQTKDHSTVGINEKNKLEEIQDGTLKKSIPEALTTQQQQQPQQPTAEESKEINIEKYPFRQTLFPGDMEVPDSYRAGFYFFFAISSAAVIFIVVRIYRLRLSRAERKYGVQGDRTNQELTPLPMAFEDGNSDEDDHTLFEINRQQIRIL